MLYIDRQRRFRLGYIRWEIILSSIITVLPRGLGFQSINQLNPMETTLDGPDELPVSEATSLQARPLAVIVESKSRVRVVVQTTSTTARATTFLDNVVKSETAEGKYIRVVSEEDVSVKIDTAIQASENRNCSAVDEEPIHRVNGSMVTMSPEEERHQKLEEQGVYYDFDVSISDVDKGDEREWDFLEADEVVDESFLASFVEICAEDFRTQDVVDSLQSKHTVLDEFPKDKITTSNSTGAPSPPLVDEGFSSNANITMPDEELRVERASQTYVSRSWAEHIDDVLHLYSVYPVADSEHDGDAVVDATSPDDTPRVHRSTQTIFSQAPRPRATDDGAISRGKHLPKDTHTPPIATNRETHCESTLPCLQPNSQPLSLLPDACSNRTSNINIQVLRKVNRANTCSKGAFDVPPSYFGKISRNRTRHASSRFRNTQNIFDTNMDSVD